MLAALARNWRVLALRGVFAVIFGILTIMWPGVTLLVLITLFGAYALVDDIFAVIAGIGPDVGDRRVCGCVRHSADHPRFPPAQPAARCGGDRRIAREAHITA